MNFKLKVGLSTGRKTKPYKGHRPPNCLPRRNGLADITTN
jgi:hypothetical protein